MANENDPEGHDNKLNATPIEDVIQAHVRKAATRSDLINLVGFQGRSDRSSYVRLYLNGTLQEYVEIPEDQAEIAPLSGADSPLVLVSVAEDAAIDYVRIERKNAAAAFLGGAITERHLAQSAASTQGNSEMSWVLGRLTVLACFLPGSGWACRPTGWACGPTACCPTALCA